MSMARGTRLQIHHRRIEKSERIVVGLEGVRHSVRRHWKCAGGRVYANDVWFRPAIGQSTRRSPTRCADSWLRLESARLWRRTRPKLYDDHQTAASRPPRPSISAPRPASMPATARVTQGGYAYAKEYHVERLWARRGQTAAAHAPREGDGAQLLSTQAASKLPRAT